MIGVRHGAKLALAMSLLALSATAQGRCGASYGADGIALDDQGRVWFTHYEDTRIGRLSPANGGLQEYLPSTQVNAAGADQAGRVTNGVYDYGQDNGFTGIALDERRQTLWTARFNSQRLVRFSLRDQKFFETTLPGIITFARGALALAPDGGLWLLLSAPEKPEDTALRDFRLVQVTAAGQVARQIPLPGGMGSGAALALDGTGTPWLALIPENPAGSAALYRLAGDRLVRQPLPGDIGRVIGGLAFDGQGRLWLSAPNKNAIVRLHAGQIKHFSVPTANAYPNSLFVSPTGEVWFSEWEGNRWGRITRDDRLREYPLPAGDENPLSLAFARDGRVWFSSLLNYGLFRLDPASGKMRAFPLPPPSNWFNEAASTASFCTVPVRPAAPPPMAALGASLRPPQGEAETAALFLKSCHTQCHTWYRVEQAASRRTAWDATVDRMMEVNGAKAIIDDAARERIIRYLNAHYRAVPP